MTAATAIVTVTMTATAATPATALAARIGALIVAPSPELIGLLTCRASERERDVKDERDRDDRDRRENGTNGDDRKRGYFYF